MVPLSLSSLFPRRRPIAEPASRYESLRRTFRTAECAELDAMSPADAVVVLERWLGAEWVRSRQLPTNEAARTRLASLRDPDPVATRERLIEATITFCLWRANPGLLPVGTPVVPPMPDLAAPPHTDTLVPARQSAPAPLPSGMALAWS